MTAALWNFLFFLIVIAILITIHEAGHFYVARKCGVKVFRFSIGFGPVLLRKRGADGTEYVLSLIPLGGYVKMKGELGEEDDAEDSATSQGSARGQSSNATAQSGEYAFDTDFAHVRTGAYAGDSFAEQSLCKRALIVAAGPLANILLALVVYFLCNMIGMRTLQPVVGTVVPEGRAAMATLQEYDLITAVDGVEIRDWNDFSSELIPHLDQSVTLQVAGNLGEESQREVVLNLQGLNVTPEMGLFSQLGMSPCVGKVSNKVATVELGSPADKAGLAVGDLIEAIDGQQTRSWSEITSAIMAAHDSTQAQVRFGWQQDAAGEYSAAAVSPVQQPSVAGSRGSERREGVREGDRAIGGAVGQQQDAAASAAGAGAANSNSAQASTGAQEVHLSATPLQGRPLTLDINRNGDRFSVVVVPEWKVIGENGQGRLMIGIGAQVENLPGLFKEIRYGPVDAAIHAVTDTARMSMLIVSSIKQMVAGALSVKNIGGPIAIARVAGDSASVGLTPFLWFLATISINLAIFNLIPIPVLDGGQLLFFAYEKVTGRAPSPKVRFYLTMVGLSLILSLAFVAIFNDLMAL